MDVHTLVEDLTEKGWNTAEITRLLNATKWTTFGIRVMGVGLAVSVSAATYGIATIVKTEFKK